MNIVPNVVVGKVPTGDIGLSVEDAKTIEPVQWGTSPLIPSGSDGARVRADFLSPHECGNSCDSY
ncbi:MAG: hypothetical protein ACKVHE_30280 [Planctomycetales bacterium]